MDINDTPTPTPQPEQPDLAAKVAKLEKRVAWLEEHARLLLEAIPTSMLLRELADRTDVAEEEST